MSWPLLETIHSQLKNSASHSRLKKAEAWLSQSWPNRKTEEYRYTSLAFLKSTSVPVLHSPELAHWDLPILKTLISREEILQQGPIAPQNFVRDMSYIFSDAIREVVLSNSQPAFHILNLNNRENIFGDVCRIVCGKNTSNKIVIDLTSTNTTVFNNIVIKQDPNSHLEMIVVGCASGQTLTCIDATLESDARLEIQQFNANSNLSRTEYNIDLSGNNSYADIKGIAIASGNETTDVIVNMRHLAPYTNSRQHFKSVLSGKSKSVFLGGVYIAKNSQKVDSSQLSQCLLLSKDSEMDAKPQLEVYADDVKAGHGAAIGRLDDDQIFYLQSRGVPHADAVSLLSLAFVDEIINSVADEHVKKQIQYQLHKKLQIASASGRE